MTSSTRPFDILIYGATGFAGKHVVNHLLSNHPELKIAIAGRNKSKLEQLASDFNSNLANNDSTTKNIIQSNQILVASSSNKHELIEILSQAKICLACAGPYRHVGRNIVEAAIEANTDYLDLCGEPQFFDDMLTSYDSMAREKNVLVISACAFDCVPSELCYQFASRELLKKYKNNSEDDDDKTKVVVTNVEIVHTFQGIKRVNATTFHAAVDGFHASYNGELKASRNKVKQCFPELQDILSSQKTPSTWKKFIATPSMTSPLYHKLTNSYLLKFMGADASCILSSDRYLRLRANDTQQHPLPPKPHLSVCFGLPQKSHAYKFLAYGGLFSTLAKWSWGCKVLHANPEFFTNGFFTSKGPTEEDLKDGQFATFGTAYGLTREQNVTVKFSGGEPGYVETSSMMSALAMTVLQNRDKLKFDGGVMLPGAAFIDCDVVFDHLRKEGLQIDVVDINQNGDIASNDEKV